MVREIAAEMAGKAAVAQINIDNNPRLAQQFSITGVPALLLIRQGKVIDRMDGAGSRQAVIAWISRHLGRH